MITQISIPSKDIGALPDTSYWVPAWHPVIYNLQRNDFQFGNIGDNTGMGGGVEIQIQHDVTSELIIGDSVYVNCPHYNIDDNYHITAFSYDSGADLTTIVIDYPTSIGSVATWVGYMNLLTARQYYRVEINLYDASNNLVLSTPAQYRPDSKGNIKADIQQLVQLMVDADDKTYNYPAQYQASNLGQRFSVAWREFYKTPTGNYTSLFATPVIGYVTHAVRQVGNRYGNNMAEYVMFGIDADLQYNPGLFLTMFKKPTYFKGYPYDIAFLYDKNITDLTEFIGQNETTKDINGGTIATVENVLVDYHGYTNRITLQSTLAACNSVDLKLTAKVATVAAKASFDDSAWHTYIEDPFLIAGRGIFCALNDGSQKVLGCVEFTTDAATTLNNLITAINTNAAAPASLATVNSVSAHSWHQDNSAGFTAVYNTGTNIVVTAPTTGTSYNGLAALFYIYDISAGNQYVYLPLFTFSGGADAGYADLSGTGGNRWISEIKTILVDNTCYDNPLYFKWLNPIGGFDYWLFNWKQVSNDTISNPITFEPYIKDLSAVNSRAETLSKDSQEEIDLGAEGLSMDDINAIRNILASPKVLMYVGTGTDSVQQWITVQVKADTFEISDNRENKFNIEFTIQPPQKFIQKQ